jgi:hypothetical protein
MVPVPRTMTVSSLIAGTYAPPAVLLPMTSDLRDGRRRQAGLVVEDSPEVLAMADADDMRVAGMQKRRAAIARRQ